MPLDPALVGRVFAPTLPFDVSAAHIAAFAAATGDTGVVRTYDSDPMTAPPTFPIVVAFEAMQQLMSDPQVGIELRHVVHGEQRFAISRPVVAGDVLAAQIGIESLRTIGGADIIGTRSEITAHDGEHVCTAYATLVHRPPEGR